MNNSHVYLYPAIGAILIGCGAGTPEIPVEEKPAPAPVAETDEEEESMQVVGLTGSLARDEVEMVMNDSGIMKMELCLEWIYTRRDYIFGEVKFHFEVLPTGKVGKVEIASSTIGDLEFEKCLIKKFSYLKFPKPKGGATDVDYSYTIDVPKGTREPDSIASPMVDKALEEFKGDMKDCVGKSLGGLTIIAYLGEAYSEEIEVPGKKKKKKLVEMEFCHALALSGTLPEGADEDAMQCILNASKSWKIPLNPGTYVSKGKVSY
ncbi:MAG: AgmX/PglI C-terminal domain-containing protein [Pseudomonadota bacterium]